MTEFTEDDERVEELNTLQAIYPELTVDLRHPPTPTARIELPVVPAKALPVVFGSEPEVHRLAYLPPLLLDIILAEGYPTAQAPVFKLATDPPWLSDTVLKRLRKQGQTLWEEYGGIQMLYAYVSYLQEATETAFDIVSSADETLPLPETMKTAMLDLNERLKIGIFSNETFDCGICLEPKKGSACYRIQRCSHVFCKACLQDYYNNCITEGDVNNVKCLSPDCGKTGNVQADRTKKDKLLSPKELLQIPLELGMVQRYAQIRRKKKIEADPSIVFCPRTWCQGPMRSSKYPKITDVSQMDDSSDSEPEPEGPPSEQPQAKRYGVPNSDRLVVCEDCKLAFCRICLASWHGDFITCITRAEGEISEEEKASLNYILQNTSPCPTCDVPCQKAYGCNHMTCFQCKSHFCYLCSAWLEPGNPYRHFNDPANKSCFQRLMDGAMGENGEGQPEMRFGGRRGAENEAVFWENEAVRLQIEELEETL